MDRLKISSGSRWETRVGYSRAIRAGKNIYVSGTTSIDASGKIVGKGDPYLQTRQIFNIIEKSLEKAGACLANVIRTRMYVVNIDQWKEIGRAHGEFFAAIQPATTMVEVSRLIDPDMLVEIEADAVLDD